MSSSGSTRGSRTKGSEWTYALYFTPDADKPEGPPIRIEQSNLKSYFSTVDGIDDKVLKVKVYKQNLNAWIPKWFGLWHEFTVVKSTNWWWSFEKNADGLCVQRSIKLESVQDKYRGIKRPGRGTLKWFKNRNGCDGETIIHMFNTIYEQNALEKVYNLLFDNCQNFAMAVYRNGIYVKRYLRESEEERRNREEQQ